MKNEEKRYETVGDVLWRTWDVFWQRTSIAGLANAGGAGDSKLRRLVWITVFAVAAGFTAWSLLRLFEAYSLEPLTTAVKYNHLSKVRNIIILTE